MTDNCVDLIRELAIARLDLRAGDVLVIRVPEGYGRNPAIVQGALATLRDSLAHLGCRVLMISGEIEIEVIRGAANEGA